MARACLGAGGVARTPNMDGDWYRRAWFDDGAVIGSATNDNRLYCAILGSNLRAAEPQRAAQAMIAVERELIDEDNGLALLFKRCCSRRPSTICRTIRDTSRAIHPAFVRMAASIPMPQRGRSSPLPSSAKAARRRPCSRYSTRSTMSARGPNSDITRRFEVTLRRRSARMRIKVDNPNGFSRGVASAQLDGILLVQRPLRVELIDDARVHELLVTLG